MKEFSGELQLWRSACANTFPFDCNPPGIPRPWILPIIIIIAVNGIAIAIAYFVLWHVSVFRRGRLCGCGWVSCWGLPGSCANFERKFIASFIICLSLLLLLLRLPYPSCHATAAVGASILMAITVRGESVLAKIKFCLPAWLPACLPFCRLPNPIKYLVNCANQVVNLMLAKFLIELWINEISFLVLSGSLQNFSSTPRDCLSLSSWLIKINCMFWKFHYSLFAGWNCRKRSCI